MTEPSDQIETSLSEVDPRTLKLLPKNAHFMPERTFKQLCDNLRRDGVLTSAPLCAEVDGETLVLSGNHRVKAALAVGLKTIPIILVESELSHERLVAIQLSHNALVGEDDPNILQELYASLSVLEQRYSGLTDVDLGILTDPELKKLSVGMPEHDEVTIAFPPDRS